LFSFFSVSLILLLLIGFVLEILTGICILAQYVMVVLKGSVPMAFGGTQEPAAYGDLVSIGGLNPDVNKKLSAGIASILESKLSIPKPRFYLKFYDSKARRNYVFSDFILVYLHVFSHCSFSIC
jgi:hypothetical protein